MENLSIAASFIGGLLTFFSPCLLPLIPAIFAYIGIKEQEHAEGRLATAVFFVIGFTVMFSFFGILANSLLSAMGASLKLLFSKIGGFTIMLFGLYLVGLLKFDFLGALQYSPKIKMKAKIIGPFVMGCAFSLTVSPCFSAIFGGIVVLASVSAIDAYPLFLAYSFGIALPFLAYAALLDKIRPHLKPINKFSRHANLLAGILLILFGMAALLGWAAF